VVQCFKTRQQAEEQLKSDQMILELKPKDKDIDIDISPTSAIKNNSLKYTVYCDGSCTSSTGGWAYKILETNEEQHGSKTHTTNNKMELTAAIMALSRIPDGSQVKIFTDSKYVIDGITRYIKNWQKNGWRTTAKKAVLNQDLWQALDKLVNTRQVEWHWVKGHSDDPHNDRVDYLAKLSYK
jgi:ribonuclease HI